MRLKMVWNLIKLNLKVTFSLSALVYYARKRDRRFFTSIGITLLVLAALAIPFYIYMSLLRESFMVLLGSGQEALILTSAVVLSSILVFFLGLVYVVSVFYFSRDMEFFVALPLRPVEVLAGKFAGVLLGEYLTITPFLLPALLLYGIQLDVAFSYWLLAILVFVLTPVIPLAVASLASLFLMSVTNLGQKRDLLRIVGMSLLFVILMGINFLVVRIPAGGEEELIISILSDPEGLIKYTGRIYPPSLWVTRLLSLPLGSGVLLNLVYFAGTGILVLGAMLVGAEKLFYKGLIGGQEVRKGKTRIADVTEALNSRRSPYVAIALREIKILFRVPIYLFNSIAILVIAPVALVLPLVAGGGLGAIEEMIANIDEDFLQLGGAGFLAVMSLVVPALSSSFSREGKYFRISQFIPMHPFQQILGKLLSGYLLTFLAVPIVVLLAVLYAPMSLWRLLLMIFIGLLVSFPMLVLSLVIDLLRPYLKWENPQQAIKQNLNVLLALMAGGGYLYLLFRFVQNGEGMSLYNIYLIISSLSLLLGGLLLWILYKLAPGRYRQINV